MESNSQPATFNEDPIAMHPRSTFSSEEEMKAYYLHLADIFNVKFTEEPSEFLSLSSLRRKLKQYTTALQLISTHEWGTGIAEIHDACGVNMIHSKLEQQLLLKANKEIGLHLQFIMKLAGNVGFLKQLLGVLYFHYQNVVHLLNKLEKE